MMKKYSVLCVIISVIAVMLASGCGKPEISGFEFNGETLLFRGDENGRGTLYSGSTKVYEGEFSGGVIHGEGKLYTDGKLRYEGEFVNNQALGSGTLFTSSGRKMFEGVIRQNEGTTYSATGYLFNETGKKTFYGDITVSGDSLTIGTNGMLFYPSGAIFYWGDFRNGEPDGNGTWYDEDGNILETE